MRQTFTTMKRFILFFIPLLYSASLYAQNLPLVSEESQVESVVEKIMNRRDSLNDSRKPLNKYVPHINIELNTSANVCFSEGKFDELYFKIDRVRLEFKGQLLENHLTYHYRQSFTRPDALASLDRMATSIECAYLTWHASQKFNLVAGKQFVAIGGYEAWVNALKVREFSEFNDNMAVWLTGVSGEININSDHQIILQVVDNWNVRANDWLTYGLPTGVAASKVPLLGSVNWNAFFADKAVHLRYAASVGSLAKGKNIYYLTFGNIYEKGPVISYIDVMYSREDIDSQQRITLLQPGNGVSAQNVQYLSVIADFEYAFLPNWNAYVKGAYEMADVFRENGKFRKGRYMNCWNAQACVEWYPFTRQNGLKVYAHYVYKGHRLTQLANDLGGRMPDMQRVSLGLVYTIPVL